MRRGFTGTTQKPSSSRLKGNAHHLHFQKRQDKFAQMWVTRLSFSTFTELCNMNLLYKDRLWSVFTALTYYGVCRKMCREKDMNIGIRGIGLFAIVVAHSSMCVNYWVKTKCHSTLSLLTRFSAAWHKNSRWRYSEGHIMVSVWLKQTRRTHWTSVIQWIAGSAYNGGVPDRD